WQLLRRAGRIFATHVRRRTIAPWETGHRMTVYPDRGSVRPSVRNTSAIRSAPRKLRRSCGVTSFAAIDSIVCAAAVSCASASVYSSSASDSSPRDLHSEVSHVQRPQVSRTERDPRLKAARAEGRRVAEAMRRDNENARRDHAVDERGEVLLRARVDPVLEDE